MKLSTIWAFALFSCQPLQSQVEITWEKQFGGSSVDVGNSFIVAPDGGFVAIGYSTSTDFQVEGNNGGLDYWVIKTDAEGEIIWQNDLGGSYNDQAFSVINANGGGYLVLGASESNDGDVTGNHNGAVSDFWLVKLDNDGIVEWSHCYGGLGYDNGRVIIATSDGGYAMTGETSSDDGDVTGNQGSPDAWLVKITAQGEIEWQRAHGGASGEFGRALVETDDGGYLLAASSSSWDSGDVTGNHGGSDYWISRYDNEGLLLWQRSYGSSGSDIPTGIAKTDNGEYVICGSGGNNDGDISGFLGTYDYWVIRIDDDGELLWQKCFGGWNDDKATSIIATPDGGFGVTGFTMSDESDVSGYHAGHDIWFVKIDGAGTLLWEGCIGGSSEEDGNSIQHFGNDEFAVLGHTSSNNGDVISQGFGSADFWLVKFTHATNTIKKSSGEIGILFAPNPCTASTKCQILGGNLHGNSTLTLVDVLGRVVYTQKITENSFQIERGNLISGVYQYELREENFSVASGKLVFE